MSLDRFRIQVDLGCNALPVWAASSFKGFSFYVYNMGPQVPCQIPSALGRDNVMVCTCLATVLTAQDMLSLFIISRTTFSK